MSTSHNSADRLVRRQSNWSQNAWPLLIAAIGLGATLVVGWMRHPSLARVEQWGSLPQWWIAGVTLTLVAALAVWWSRRRSLPGSAATLDEELDAKNRLETATALANDNSALARAQRVETEGFIQRAKVRDVRAGLLAGLRTLVISLALAHFLTLLSWARPWISTATKDVTKVASVQEKEKENPPGPVVPKASFTWESPESETTATAIEEVPLKAIAESASGLRDVVLDIAVNGESRLKTPLAPDALKTPGKHDIETSIYLDQLEVQPFDMVSYSLRGQRIDAPKLPETVSLVQFVQIKPPRQDTAICACENPGQCFNYIAAIKAAQLRLMKENHVLANSDLGRTHADWRKENERVGGEQAQLADKTTEVVKLLNDNGTSANVVELVEKAQPFMVSAGKKIQSTDNEPALGSQGKALALITEVEKYLKDKVSQAQCKVPPVTDPFKKNKQLTVKFKQTKAQLIELLAREQARLAGDLALPGTAAAPVEKSETPDPGKIDGTAGERQAQIRERLGALLDDPALAPEVLEHLDKGRDQAQTSQQRIDGNDFPAALEPASEAAREFRLAAAALSRAGDKVAKNELADALRALNQASDLLRKAAEAKSDQEARVLTEAAAKAVADAAQKLSEAAQVQQENGATNAAARMADLAELIQSEQLKKTLEQLNATPRDAALAQAAATRMDQLAERAAQQRNPGALSQAELARLVDRMERAKANLQRLASTTPVRSPGHSPEQSQSPSESKSQSQSPSPGAGQGKQGKGTTLGSGGSGPALHGQVTKAPVSDGPVPQGTTAEKSGFGGTPLKSARAAELRQQLALELLDELREGSLDALAVKPDSASWRSCARCCATPVAAPPRATWWRSRLRSIRPWKA